MPEIRPPRFRFPPLGGSGTRALVVGGGGLFALLVLMGACTTYVAPNEVGILQSNVLPPTGIRPGLLEGGRLHLVGPGQAIHAFPTDLQVMQLTSDRNDSAPARNQRIEPAVEVNTSDGSRVRVDVTVLYHVDDAFTVMQTAGPGRLFETNAVIPKVQAALKKNLGEMHAEDFYDVKLRARKSAAAEQQVREELKEKGIHIDHLLIRQYYYNKDYEQQIEDKKIQDQLVFTRGSEAEAAKENAKKLTIEATGKANVAVEQQRGAAEVTKIQAEADNYKRKKQADANLLVQLATAKGTELENAAYQGAGSENMVGMKMADVLQGLDVILVPTGGKDGVNPLDLDQSLKMFDVK
ncbi:MAG: SPFH domain-containing protein [Myxococcota bacterium]